MVFIILRETEDLSTSRRVSTSRQQHGMMLLANDDVLVRLQAQQQAMHS